MSNIKRSYGQIAFSIFLGNDSIAFEELSHQEQRMWNHVGEFVALVAMRRCANGIDSFSDASDRLSVPENDLLPKFIGDPPDGQAK